MSDSDPNILKEVFSPLAGALALFGGLGGLVRALAFPTSVTEALRLILIGAATAFGLGTLSPYVLQWLLGSDFLIPAEVRTAVGFLCGAAFLVGLFAMVIVVRLTERVEGRINGKT